MDKLPNGQGKTDVEDQAPLLGIDGSSKAPAVKQRNGVMGIPAVLFAGICYCCASGSMVLLNKHALASFGFSAPNALLGFQCAMSVVLVKLCALMGLVKLQPLKRDLVIVWFPVNLIFVVSAIVAVTTVHPSSCALDMQMHNAACSLVLPLPAYEPYTELVACPSLWLVSQF